MYNRFLLSLILFFCLIFNTTESIITDLTALKSSDGSKTVYFYHDTHFPHVQSQNQVESACAIEKALGNDTLTLVEGLYNTSFIQKYKDNNQNLDKELECFNASEDDPEAKDWPNKLSVDQLINNDYYSNELVMNAQKKLLEKEMNNGFLQSLQNKEFCNCSTDTRTFMEVRFYKDLFSEIYTRPLLNQISGLKDFSRKEILNKLELYPVSAQNFFLPVMDACDSLIEQIRFISSQSVLYEKFKTDIDGLKDQLLGIKNMIAGTSAYMQEKFAEHNLLGLSGIVALYNLARQSIDKIASSNIAKQEWAIYHYNYCLGIYSQFWPIFSMMTFIQTQTYNLTLLDIFLISNILQSPKSKIIIYAGDIHQRIITKCLEILGYTTIYSSGQASQFEDHKDLLKDAIEEAINNIGRDTLIANDKEYHMLLDAIINSFISMSNSLRIVSKEEFELPLRQNI